MTRTSIRAEHHRSASSSHRGAPQALPCPDPRQAAKGRPAMERGKGSVGLSRAWRARGVRAHSGRRRTGTTRRGSLRASRITAPSYRSPPSVRRAIPDHGRCQPLWENMLAAFPDFHIDPGPMLHGDDHVFVEVTCSGHSGASSRAYRRRRSFTLPHVANLFEFEGDQMVCERVYLDLAGLTRQLTEPE